LSVGPPSIANTALNFKSQQPTDDKVTRIAIASVRDAFVEKVVIAGAGHAAGQVVATLKQKKFAGQIVLLGDENWYPYQRPPLSKKFLAGELPAERLYIKPPGFYEEENIVVRLGTRVSAIDRATHTVQTDSGEDFVYDKLILALGSKPRRIGVPGADLAGVHYLRDIDDVTGIRESMLPGGNITIIGAGYIGLEVAAVTRKLGMNVTVIELADRVMSRVVSPQMSEYYEQQHRKQGVKLLLSTGVESIGGEQSVQSVQTIGAGSIRADLVVVGIGIVPNTEIAVAAGLEIDDGIKVDDRCFTSDPDILAVGDCTSHPNGILGRRLRLESVHNALEQAKTAASNILGDDIRYSQVPWFWSDQYDLKLQIAGLSQGYDETVLRGDRENQSFACLYLREGALIAIDAVNSPRDFVQAKQLIAERRTIDSVLLRDTSVQLKDMSA